MIDMKFNEAQANMRHSYFGGGPGVLASGMVWLIAGIVALSGSIQASVFALFIGGMFIHPLGMMLSKALKRSGKHETGNPLATLALESTFILFLGIFMAFSIVQVQSDWFFPIMLMVIGGRYLLFSTIYGMRIYWVLGGLLAVAGILCLLFQLPFAVGAFIGGTVEIGFSFLIMYLTKRVELE